MTQNIQSTIANNREDGGRLILDLIVQHFATHDWYTLDQEEEARLESYRCAWDDLVAPYIQAIDALHQRIQHAEYGEVYWQGKYDNLELQMKMDVWNRKS